MKSNRRKGDDSDIKRSESTQSIGIYAGENRREEEDERHISLQEGLAERAD
jgi:hypothetical protein